MRKPVGIGETIGIGIGDDLPGGSPQANVSRDTESLVRLMNRCGCAEIVRVSIAFRPSSRRRQQSLHSSDN